MKRIFSICTVFFAFFLAAGPVLTVPQGDTPLFDGACQDAVYSEALKMDNFFLSGTASSPQEKSSVSLLHDGKNLYVAALLKSYALHPASNMRKEFLDKLTGENQPVWDDDSFELRALSESGERFYFGFNANGATFIRIPKRFHRDMPRVVCRKERGFFSAEMKLPLELLNGKWSINFVRFEKRLKETSTMLPESSYNLWSHQDFWKLFRGGKSLSLPRLCELANANTQTVELLFNGAASGEYLIRANGQSRRVQFTAADGKPVKVVIPGSKNGENRFTLEVNCGKAKWSYPEYMVNSPESLFSVSCEEKGVEISFNGERVSSGAVLSLARKQNLLEITSGKPQVVLTIRHKGYGGGDYPGTFDGAEKFVSQGNKKILTAPAGSKPPYKFRKIFTSTPRLFNPWGVEKRTLLLSAGDAYDFEINPVEWGIFPLENIEFKLLVPQEIEVLDAVSRVRYPEGFPPLAWPEERNMYRITGREERTINGKKYQLITIIRTEKLDKVANMTKHFHSMRERCHLILRSKTAGFKGEIQLFAAAGKPAIAEEPKILPVEVVKKHDGIQLKKLTVSLYAQMQGNLDHQLEKAIFDTYKSAGVNELFLETERKVDDFTMMFFLELEDHGYYRSAPSFKVLFDKYPQLKARTRSGRPRGEVSLTALADMEEVIFDDLKAIFGTLKKKYPSLKKLFWDFEHSPFNGLYSDYSEISLAKFKKDYNIAEDKLTPEVIQKKYPSQWIDFRTRELGRAVAVVRRACNANGYKLVMYSDYATDDCAGTYGLDWKYIRNAADEVYCGYGRNAEIIRKTRELTAPSKTVFGLLTNSGSSTYYRSQILRRMLDSRGGVLCWYEQGTGFRELQEIAAVTSIASQCEEAIIAGKDVKPANLLHNGMDEMVVTRQVGKDFYTFILNEEKVSSRVRITFPAPAQDLNSGKVYPAGKNLSLKIPAMKIAAFKWKEN